MSKLDANFWNDRWKENQTGWDIGYPSPPIVDFFSNFPDKHAKILIPGCGNAHEAVFLAQNGFTNITVLDISEHAIQRLCQTFAPYPQVRVIHGNFFDHTETYDYIIEQTFFCALDPILRTQYVSHIASLLKPNGKIVGLLFNIIFEKEGPPFGGSAEEYQMLFSNLFTINKMENCTHSIPPRLGTELFILFTKKG